MNLIDLTHPTKRRSSADDAVPVVVRSADTMDRVPLDRLVTQATVVDLTMRRDTHRVDRADLAGTAVADIAGCILRTGWSDSYLAGQRGVVPELTVDAAAYLLEGGVRTIVADFPVIAAASDMLLHNSCVLVHCVSGLSKLSKSIVRVVALPLKLEDTFSAGARVIAIEE